MIRWFVGAVAVVVAAGITMALILRPPAPLIVPDRDVELAGVTVVNPGLERRAGQRITIQGSTIAAISVDVDRPAVAHQYAGTYVLPGLIDMHVHHPPARVVLDTQLFGLLYLAHGVTTVRDTGNFDGSIFETRRRIADGEFPGPRIVACGPIVDGDPPVWPGSTVVRTRADGERAVDDIAAMGTDCIKAYQNLNADALRGVRAAASRHGLPLIGHVPSAVALEDAHLDEIQHLTGIGSIGAPPTAANPAEMIRTLLRFWAELDESRIPPVARISAEQKLAHTPTIVVLDQLTRLDDYATLLSEPDAQLLPRYYREFVWRPIGLSTAIGGGWPDGRTVRANFRMAVRQLREAGVTLHVGTDVLNPFVVPGTTMHEELRNFTECGFSVEEALAAATRGNGAALPPRGLGVIEPGAPADLLVFREDPSLNLTALATLEAVIADGRLYSKRALDDAIARYRRTFTGWLYDRITMQIVQWSGPSMTDVGPPDESHHPSVDRR